LFCARALLSIVLFSSIRVQAYEIDKETRVTEIIDGDSFKVTNDEVRLADISAPEWDKPGGDQATNILTNLINGKKVYLDTDPTRSYGRLVAVVYIKHNATHYKNVNKVLWDNHVPPFYEDNYLNEFNPSSWNLYEIYASPPPPSPPPPPTPPPPPPDPNEKPRANINGPYNGEVNKSVLFWSYGSARA
jgi:hypothetical protein